MGEIKTPRCVTAEMRGSSIASEELIDIGQYLDLAKFACKRETRKLIGNGLFHISKLLLLSSLELLMISTL